MTLRWSEILKIYQLYNGKYNILVRYTRSADMFTRSVGKLLISLQQTSKSSVITVL